MAEDYHGRDAEVKVITGEHKNKMALLIGIDHEEAVIQFESTREVSIVDKDVVIYIHVPVPEAELQPLPYPDFNDVDDEKTDDDDHDDIIEAPTISLPEMRDIVRISLKLCVLPPNITSLLVFVKLFCLQLESECKKVIRFNRCNKEESLCQIHLMVLLLLEINILILNI